MRIVKLILLFIIVVLILVACTKKEILTISSEPTSVSVSTEVSASSEVSEPSVSIEINSSSVAAGVNLEVETNSSSVAPSDNLELETPQAIQSLSSQDQSKAEQESIIKITSTKNKLISWSTSNTDTANNLISLLMKYDQTSPTLDIREKDFTIIINQDEKKREYHFWIEFTVDVRAIIAEVVEEGGWDYHFIPIEESNQLQEWFKTYGLSG